MSGASTLPAPIEFPEDPMPCMVGQFRLNKSTGVHRCVGKWAMTKNDLEHSENMKSLASSFELKISAGGPDSFPASGNVRQSSKDIKKVFENHLYLNFEKNSGVTWNVHGQGVNIHGSLTITGLLDTNRRLEVYRAYTKTPLRRHRRCSVCVPVAVTASADYASSVPPAPTRRIKDIGNCDNTHLPKGLRRCVRLLYSLMNVSEKSICFNEPVDHVGLHLHDYQIIIKRPMDLGTFRHKLERGEYQNTGEFSADVRLVFSNARLYNSNPSTLVHKAAQALFELFESKFAALGSILDEPSLKRETSRSGSGGGNSGGSASSRAAACADDAEHSSKANRGKRKGSKAGGALGKRESKKARTDSLTFGEKKALTEAINKLDNERDIIPVIEMILARMLLRGSGEEIEVAIESIDTLTLRNLQSYIRELNERGGSIRNGGTASKANRGKRKGSRAGGALGKRESKKARTDPLTFGEKKALTEAINKLDDEKDIIPVIEMILARMPLRGSGEEIEVDIESIDTLTLRDSQSYIRELSERDV